MPDQAPDSSNDPQALARATRERDALRERAAWWEDRKGVVLFPAMMAGFGAGYGVALAIGSRFALPEQSRWFGAVIGVLVVGRTLTSMFDPRRLVAAQKRVDQLRAQRDRTRDSERK